MNNKSKSVFVALFIVLFAVQSVAATTVSIENVFVEPNGNVTASIMINNVTNLGVADINLTFNQSVVQVSGADNSDFDFLHAVINNSNGMVRIGAFQISSSGLNGNIKLADVLLDAVGSAGRENVLNLNIIELKEVSTPETSIYATVDCGIFAIIDLPKPPIALSNTTGMFWIKWAWTDGLNSDLIEVYIDGVWVNNCTKQYYNDTYLPHATRTIVLRGYNTSLNKYSVYINQTTTIPNHAPVAVPESVHHHNNVGSTYPCKVILNASASYDPDGSITNYHWDFADGASGTGVLVEHVYSAGNWNGTGYDPFIVSLTVDDDIDLQINDTIIIPVNVYIAGDSNGDGVVDIFDATIVGLEWGETCECDTWRDMSDKADLNNDCVVDIFDAVIIGGNWGHTAY
ncbi:MAG: PKD domain-containing protein [Methanosarcinaceae archaeon]